MDKILLQDSSIQLPLVVDLDGTLTLTDTLVESIFSLLKKNPFNALLIFLWLFRGRAEFKRLIATANDFSASNLPWREDFVAWLRLEHARGRQIILATAAHTTIAEDAASHMGFFSDVIATSNGENLKGSAKLIEIQKRVGDHFCYAGDSAADLPVWRASSTAILAGVSNAVRREVSQTCKIEIEFTNEKVGLHLWMRALRVHQWLKNILIFVPLASAFAFTDGEKALSALIAFASFSLAASATYIFNDLWDLESDRKHARKCKRPFASGKIAILQGVAMACILLAIALVTACFVSFAFAGMVVAYIILTTLYSWTLKSYVLIDVLMLALLYTFRVFAGSVATNIHITQWLLSFSVFMFFGLALVKRCAELKSLQLAHKNVTEGRDYQVRDLAVLLPLGIGASMCSVVVFGLYIGTPVANSTYSNADLLWLVGIGLLYWNARLWIKTARGEMHDDPIIFAVRDFGSRITISTMLLIAVAARFLS